MTQLDLLFEQRTFVERCARGELSSVWYDTTTTTSYKSRRWVATRQQQAIVEFEVSSFEKPVQTFHGIELQNVAVASDTGRTETGVTEWPSYSTLGGP